MCARPGIAALKAWDPNLSQTRTRARPEQDPRGTDHGTQGPKLRNTRNAQQHAYWVQLFSSRLEIITKVKRGFGSHMNQARNQTLA